MIKRQVRSLLGKISIIFFVAALLSIQAKAQETAAGLTVYPKMQELIINSAKSKNGLLVMQVQWMDTVFQLERQYQDFVTTVPIPKESNSYYEIYQEAPWDGDGFVVPHANCHGFGLDQSFRYAGIDAQAFFSPTTYVDPSALEVLLKTTYHKTGTLDATSMKDLKTPLEPGSLLIFRDSTGMAIHTAFQANRGVLSKNGRFEPRLYHELEHLKKVYYMALTIDLYQLDTERVMGYLSGQELQALLKE